GKPHGMKVIGPCHIRRIEAGILSWGCDITYETNPFEVGYGFEKTWMVDLDQEADFIGKQALQRIKQQGISRKLVGVEIDGPSVGSFNDGSMIDVFDLHDPHGLRIGEVTSACYSPRLGRHIGYATVPLAYEALGPPLAVDCPHGPQDAVGDEHT